MGKEIERKFLVASNDWRGQAKRTLYRQGYLSSVKERVVRVRSIEGQGVLTIKGINKGLTRAEFEYDIPSSDTEVLLEMCEKPLIEKWRTKIGIGGLVWEVDEFLGDNEGLIVAEIELEDEHQVFAKPPWLGEEVSEDPRYYNANLIQMPYSKW